MAGAKLNAPIFGLVATADDRGYWLVAKDGGVFAFGDAHFYGSVPGLGLHVRDIVGLTLTADQKGYLLVGANGQVYAFGNSRKK